MRTFFFNSNYEALEHVVEAISHNHFIVVKSQHDAVWKLLLAHMYTLLMHMYVLVQSLE